MTHKQVIENFITKGEPGAGTYVKATADMLYSQIPSVYQPFGHKPWGETAAGREAPLAVRLEDGSLLANGARLLQPMDSHQWRVLKALESRHDRFRVVPFHSIAAAITDGEIDDWDREVGFDSGGQGTSRDRGPEPRGTLEGSCIQG